MWKKGENMEMMLQRQGSVKTCEELLLEKENRNICFDSSKLKFDLGNDSRKDIYNITAPFEFQGERWIAGRVEERDSEYSNVIFFRQRDDKWEAADEIEPIPLQDPFITRIQEEIILGGVEVFDDAKNPGKLNYRTVFYRGTSLNGLKRFANGPDRMKDIRLCVLADHRILVFTRPQGEIGGRGKIGYTFLHNLNELSPERINEAVILENQFVTEEWGGANELHLLANGKIGVLSHIARFDEKGDRHYYSTAFCFEPETGDYTPMEMIAARKDFESGESKRPDLCDVIFSGGLIRKKNEIIELYCGVSDAEGHMTITSDPFLKYEKE